MSESRGRWGWGDVLVGHDNQEALRRIFVGLDLIVRAMHAGAAGQEKQELA